MLYKTQIQYYYHACHTCPTIWYNPPIPWRICPNEDETTADIFATNQGDRQQAFDRSALPTSNTWRPEPKKSPDMKKQISFIVAMLLVAATVFANQLPVAPPRLLVNIEKASEPAALEVRLANIEQKSTLLLLQDGSGKIWFSQHIWRKHGYARKLNLKGMPDGTYTLSINHDDATVIQVLRLSGGVLEVPKLQQLNVPTKSSGDLARGN